MYRFGTHHLAALLAVVAINASAADAKPDLPLIDGHFHVMPFMDPAEVLQAMDRNGIRAAGGANAIGNPQRNAYIVDTLGARYIRSTGQGQWLSLKSSAGVGALEVADSAAFRGRLAAMETDLRDNGARVIGEIHVSSQNSAANPLVNIRIRANAPTLRAMFDLAAKYKRPLNVHAEWAGDTARELAALAD